MSCVDAAIIKALVEHIGGNPDDVVVGGGSDDVVGGNGLSFIQAEWIDNSGQINVKLPEGTKIDIGTCVIMRFTQGLAPFYCSNIDDSGVKMQYKFSYGPSRDPIIFTDEGTHYSLDCPLEVFAGLPDNQTTGIFNLTGIAQIAEVLKQVILKLQHTLDEYHR